MQQQLTSFLTLGLQNVVLNDAATPNPIGILDDSPRAGPAPSQAPIGRDDVNKPSAGEAFQIMNKTIGIRTWNVRTCTKLERTTVDQLFTL